MTPPPADPERTTQRRVGAPQKEAARRALAGPHIHRHNIERTTPVNKKMVTIAATLLALAGCGNGSLATADKADWPVTTETATATTPDPPAQPDVVERAYLAALDTEGVHYTTPDAAITVGHAVCRYLDEVTPIYGEQRALIEAGQIAMDQGYSASHAGTIIGAAVGSWCPHYAPTGGDR